MNRKLFMGALAVSASYALCGGLIGMATAGSQPQRVADREPTEPPPCRATVSPGNLDTNIEKVEVSALLSNDIGIVKSAAAQANSGIAVAEVKSMDETSVTIAMSTKGAKPGTWSVTFAGESGTCTGHIAVKRAAKK